MTATPGSIPANPSNPDPGLASDSAPGEMTANAVKVIGFTIAGLTLVGFSRIAPTPAAFISIAILLGVVLTHSTQVTTLVTRFTDALGQS